MASLWSFRFLLWYMCILIVQPQVLFRFLWPWRIANLSMMLCVGLHLIAVAQEGKPLIRMGAATKLGLALFVMSYLSLHIGALQTNTSWNVHIDGLAKAVVVMIMIEATATTIQRVWAIMATIGIASLWWMKAGVRLGMQGATYRGERLMGAATGLTPDPNMFAYMACLMIPLYLYLGKYTTNKWVGWGFRSMVLVCVYIVLDTGSRSGFVMMVVLGLFCVIHYWKEHKKYIVLAIVGITLVCLLCGKAIWIEC